MLSTPRQSQSECAAILADIHQPDVNLTLWQRQLPLHIATFARLALSLDEPLAETRVVEMMNDELPELPDLAKRFNDLEGYAGFVADVAWLVQAYASLLGAQRVGLRLRILDKAMCPRYHVDWVSARLITTYAGTGSEWLPEDAMQRDALGTAQMEPRDAPLRMAEGDVALFKGERWMGNEGRGIIHRSPQVAAGERRLILTLDWLK